MRIFLIPGLMAATMLTPAAASAADIASNLDRAPGLVQVDLTGNAALQRESRGEQRAERRANRGQAKMDWQTPGDRAETRQNRQVESVDRSPNNAAAERAARRTERQDRNVNLAAQRNQRVVAAARIDRRQDVRHGDRNHDGRVDRRWDRNRDGRIDRRYDRNNNDRVDRRVDRDRDGRIDRRHHDQRRYSNNHSYGRDHHRSNRNWNHSWRGDRRYDWQRHRHAHRSHYRLGRYYAPYRDYRYRRLNIGIYLGSPFYGSRYWINNPGYYRLPPAYPGTRWIRYYDDVLLIDVYNGEVIDVIYDFFW